MIPIRDINPSLRRPFVTFLLVAASLAVYFVVQPADPEEELEFLYRQAAIACELATGEGLSATEITAQVCTDGGEGPLFADKSLLLSVIVSMFLHGGIAHLLGNMWSLYLFGNNVEDAFGRLGYLILYLASGVVATLGFVVLNPDTTVPLVGASGAIAGIMGAYLVLFPSARVVSVFPLLFFIPFTVSAGWFLLLWFVGQFAFTAFETGVAWEAHVTGFLFGMLVTLVVRRPLVRRLAKLEKRRLARLGYV